MIVVDSLLFCRIVVVCFCLLLLWSLAVIVCCLLFGPLLFVVCWLFVRLYHVCVAIDCRFAVVLRRLIVVVLLLLMYCLWRLFVAVCCSVFGVVVG